MSTAVVCTAAPHAAMQAARHPVHPYVALNRGTPASPCRYEADEAALRALRMLLRDLTHRLLGNKKWEWFWEPEEDPEWWDKVRWACGGRSGSWPAVSRRQ